MNRRLVSVVGTSVGALAMCSFAPVTARPTGIGATLQTQTGSALKFTRPPLRSNAAVHGSNVPLPPQPRPGEKQ